MTVEERAKARSTLVTKTFFRLAACAYLSWSAYRQLYMEYMKDPETHTKGYLVFACIFIAAAAVYFIYALRVFLRESRKQNAEWAAMDRAAAARAAEEAEAGAAEEAEIPEETETVCEDAAEAREETETGGAETPEEDETGPQDAGEAPEGKST